MLASRQRSGSGHAASLSSFHSLLHPIVPLQLGLQQGRAGPQGWTVAAEAMLSGARSKAPLLACRAGLAWRAVDGPAQSWGAAPAPTAAASAGWRQGGTAFNPEQATWAAGLHSSAPRRSQEEAASAARTRWWWWQVWPLLAALPVRPCRPRQQRRSLGLAQRWRRRSQRETLGKVCQQRAAKRKSCSWCKALWPRLQHAASASPGRRPAVC